MFLKIEKSQPNDIDLEYRQSDTNPHLHCPPKMKTIYFKDKYLKYLTLVGKKHFHVDNLSSIFQTKKCTGKLVQLKICYFKQTKAS